VLWRIAGCSERGGHASEGGGAVAVQVQHVDLLAIDPFNSAGSVSGRISTGAGRCCRGPGSVSLREILPAEADEPTP